MQIEHAAYYISRLLGTKLTVRALWLVSFLGLTGFLLQELKGPMLFCASLSCHSSDFNEQILTVPVNEETKESSVLMDLVHLYDTLPDVTSSETTIPPFREVSHAYPCQQSVPKTHITLATQISVTKFPRILNLVERWDGPISCAVHLASPSDIFKLHQFVTSHESLLDLVTFHVMLERPSPHFSYPINRLRNLALHGVDTDYFFNNDVDFMPSVNAHADLVQFLARPENADKRYTTLWVLPAFERFPEPPNTSVDTLDLVPETKRDLLSLLSQRGKKIQPFHIDYFRHGHEATKFDEWYKCSDGDTYPVSFTYYYEPYVIGNRHGIPNYSDLFRGYGSNKASWFADVHFSGYKFEVFCGHFVVHMNHPGRETRVSRPNAPLKDWFVNEYLRGRYNAAHVEPQSRARMKQQRRQARMMMMRQKKQA